MPSAALSHSFVSSQVVRPCTSVTSLKPFSHPHVYHGAADVGWHTVRPELVLALQALYPALFFLHTSCPLLTAHRWKSARSKTVVHRQMSGLPAPLLVSKAEQRAPRTPCTLSDPT